MGDEKGELKGRCDVLLEESAKAGHSDIGHGHLCKAVGEIAGYLTNGHAEEVALTVVSVMEPKLTEMEKRIIAQVAPRTNGDDVAFRVRRKSVSNTAYKKLVVVGLTAILGALPTVQIGGCVIRSREEAQRIDTERADRREQFAASQSNLAATLTALTHRLERLEGPR
jgi:hypothetical protein